MLLQEQWGGQGDLWKGKWIMIPMPVEIQWNLFIMDTLGPAISGSFKGFSELRHANTFLPLKEENLYITAKREVPLYKYSLQVCCTNETGQLDHNSQYPQDINSCVVTRTMGWARGSVEWAVAHVHGDKNFTTGLLL